MENTKLGLTDFHMQCLLNVA